MSEHTPGPMERWLFDHPPKANSHNIDTLAFAREQDAIREDLLAALEEVAYYTAPPAGSAAAARAYEIATRAKARGQAVAS